MDRGRELLGRLGDLLEYPTANLPEKARECLESAGGAPPEALDGLKSFDTFVASTPSGRLEEIYSASFDLAPACCLYAGFHLLGDDPRRGALLLMLKQCYRKAGLELGGELPDHLSLLLRYLAVPRDPDFEMELVGRLLLPALEKMVPALEEGNGYRGLLQAARALCREHADLCSVGACPRRGQTSGTSPDAT